MADDFVDNVITAACRLAKLRSSSTLDIHDIQLILERNYNIRVPGYASDEVRTARKFQPAPGWTQKMNAVQAAKITGGQIRKFGRGDGTQRVELRKLNRATDGDTDGRFSHGKNAENVQQAAVTWDFKGKHDLDE
ncbi:hypothetical protein LTR04_005860 [Oleoguttula sp. CCFEE 6159]|nr:hypothetical protein LTR04_005860 [Oleoguttula sp. CCFEE 6159]